MSRLEKQSDLRLAALTALLLSAILPGCSQEEEPEPGKAPVESGTAADFGPGELRTFAYDCDDSTYVVASLYRASGGLWLFLPEKTLLLPHVEAASGAKYSDGAVTFWMKGQEALLERPDGRTVRCFENRRESWFEDAKLRGMDFRAVGNEPGWTLELGPERSVLVTGYGESRYEFATPAPEADAEGRTAVYRARAGDTGIVIRITCEPCADSMDRAHYSNRVEVRVGDARLFGCGRGLH